MVWRTILNATGIAAATLLPLTLVSCNDDDSSGGTGGSGGAPSNDAGTGGIATSDAGSRPPGDAGAPDAGLPDGWVPPSGTKLASGYLSLVGVTTDNYAVYGNDATDTLYAVALTGGEPTVIGSFGDRILIRGRAVLQWSGTSAVAPLSVWTAPYGIKSLSSTSYASTAGIALSPDSSRILFFDGVDDGHTAGNIWIANIDGTEKRQLAEGIALSNTSCAPSLAFGGNTAAAAAFCWAAPTPAGDSNDASTSAAAVVQAYGGESWTASTLATNVSPRVAIAPTGESVLVTGPTGLVAYSILGGNGTTIDGEGGFGSFTKDGLSVIYTTPNQALKRSTVDSPAPVVLAPYGFAGIRAISLDENWVLGYSVIDAQQDLSDLYLTSATAPGAVTTLSTAQTAGLFRSDGFTTDSTRAIYYTDIANGVGTFFSAPVTGGMSVALGTNVRGHYAGSEANVVFNASYDGDGATRTGEIRVANAQQTVSSVIVSFADADFFIAGTKDKVVYTWKHFEGEMVGLWVATIPSF